MNKVNLQTNLRLEDKIPFVFLDKCRIFVKNKNIVVNTKDNQTTIPVQRMLNFILGGHASISSEAIMLMYKANCFVHFSKRDGLYYYTNGIGATYSSKNSEQHSLYFINKKNEIIKKMLLLRFGENFTFETEEQARGIEGSRIRTFYQDISDRHNIIWGGRKYGEGADKINNLITKSNIFLYSLCISVIHSLQYLTQLGFLHCGNNLSFVFDFSDIFKFKFFTPYCFEICNKNNNQELLENGFKDIIKREKIVDKMIDVLNYLFWDKEINVCEYSITPKKP